MYTICNFCKIKKKKLPWETKEFYHLLPMGFAIDFKQKEWLITFLHLLFKNKYRLDFIIILLSWNNVSVLSLLLRIIYNQNKGNTFFSRHVIKRFKDYNGRKKKWKQSKKKKWTCQTRTSRDLIAMQGNNWLHSIHN